MTVVGVPGVRALPGLGAVGEVDGATSYAATCACSRSVACSTEDGRRIAEAIAAAGASPVLVARDARLVGVIGVADQEREVAADTVDLLRRQGVEHIVMLTGDQETTARATAARLGVTEVHAGLLPHEKVQVVAALRDRYGSVAMVGDGVNDAPALAAADVGIAMGAIGSDAALETADVALMSDELPKIAYAIRLSRATVRNIRANITLSLVLKAIVSRARRRRCRHIVDGGRGRHGNLVDRRRQCHAPAPARLTRL